MVVTRRETTAQPQRETLSQGFWGSELVVANGQFKYREPRSRVLCSGEGLTPTTLRIVV
jgi:hypothetical protein